MLPLNPFLPYIDMASFTLFENDLHYCQTLQHDFQHDGLRWI